VVTATILLDGDARRHFAERLSYAGGVVEATLPPYETVWITTVAPA
jgi:hypothetical protein